MNIYKDILAENLDKLYNLYDLDPASPTCGFGDRLYWGWKVSDFANATLQGGVHSLAIALRLGIEPRTDFALSVIDKAIRAIPKLTTKAGSVQEAYPWEHSFCVTALVAFDVLSALRHLGGHLDAKTKQDYLAIVKPLITFISKVDEEHAIISNHLATGVAAVALWNDATGEDHPRAKSLLNIILSHQSEEGWHKEYEGADPGYNTLCIYYLAAAAEVMQDQSLHDSIAKAAPFLRHFVHPDGSLGGLYGARNTEVYYPGGVIASATNDKHYAELTAALAIGYHTEAHLRPQNIDPGNYIPILNSYAFAAWHYEQGAQAKIPPAPERNPVEANFPEAGLYVKINSTYHAVVNYKKGGVMKVYNASTKHLEIEDGGWLARFSNGSGASTQAFDSQADFKDNTIEAGFYKLNHSTATPFRFMVLRFLNLTLLRSVSLGIAFKKRIVKMLMTGKKRIGGSVTRKITFAEDHVAVHDVVQAPNGSKATRPGKFKAIHMASSGYYMKPHAAVPASSQIVRFTCD